MRIFLLLSLSLVFILKTNSQEVWTIEKCIDEALSNNVDIALQDINIDYAQLGIKQAKNAFGGNINGSFNSTLSFGRSIDLTTYQFVNQSIFTNGYNVNGSIDLFQGLQKLNGLKKSKLQAEGSILNKKISEEAIQLQLLTSFLSVLMAKEQLAQSIKQKEKTAQERKRTQDLIEDGMLAPNDIFLLDAQVAADDVSITAFNNNIAAGLADIRLIMNLDPNAEIDIAAPELPDVSTLGESLETVESIYSSALSHRSEIKSAELNEVVNDYDLKIAKGRYSPTLSFFSNIGTNYSNSDVPGDLIGTVEPAPKYFRQFGDNLTYSIGLSLNVPIFNKNITRLGVQQTTITGNQNKLLTEKAKLDLYKAVNLAYNNAVIAISNYNAAEISERTAKRSLENAEAKLADGLGSNIEFNVASNNYAIAASKLIEAKYSYIFNIKYLDFYKGIPIKL